jgi:hypothetical protein
MVMVVLLIVLLIIIPLLLLLIIVLLGFDITMPLILLPLYSLSCLCSGS